MSVAGLPNDADGLRADAAADSPSRAASVRALVESLICLMVAVLLFRTFATEGYMISTGSMAPCLLGFHKRIVCPSCGYPFAFGVAYDQSADAQSVSNDARATCPNCGQGGIDVSKVPRNYGDQLLVHKQAFEFHSPRRWDVVVFRNPSRPSEAYVKRLVGLPGEQVQLIDGDLFIDGHLVRKNLATQRSVRIPVFDQNYRPKDDPNWQERWLPEASGGRQPPVPATSETKSSNPTTRQWTPIGNGFQFREPTSTNAKSPQPLVWVNYRHWVRARGLHETTVPLEQLPQGVSATDLQAASVRYSTEAQQLACVGVLSPERSRQLLALSDDPLFQQAVRQLEAESHLAPVTDSYGYNAVEGGAPPVPVRDLMFEARVHAAGGEGQFVIEMSDGAHVFDCVFDFRAKMVALLIDRATESVCSAELPSAMQSGPVTFEMSLMDRQILMAVNGEPVLSAWEFTRESGASEVSRQPVRFGARGMDVRVEELKLYRDIYYTWARGRNGINRPFTLGPREYFVLGDNSPVSHDSRRWERGGVPERLLVGKPFVVHLPSRPGKLKLGSHEIYVRIPDLERMRYIH